MKQHRLAALKTDEHILCAYTAPDRDKVHRMLSTE